MKAYLGQWVRDTRYNHTGRVYSIHHSFDHTGHTSQWLSCQEVKPSDDDIDGHWYSILVCNGGAILVPESAVLVLTDTDELKLNNEYGSMYFEYNP